MNMYTVTITGTNYSPYSSLSSFDVLDGGFLFDPLVAPLSFFYSLTTNCGTLTGSNNVFNLTSIGGTLETNYNDLKNYIFETKGSIVYCKTNVFFNFVNFDQGRSLIKNIVFDPDNFEKKQTYSVKNLDGLTFTYPELDKSNSVYYPSEEFYTLYKPKFIINYNDGTSQTIVTPLTVAQCGILDSYKNKSMLDSVPYFKELNDVAIFINDEKNNDLLVSLLDVKNSFKIDTSELDRVELPFTTAPVPFNAINPFISQEGSNPEISNPEIPINVSPIDILPIAIYRYGESFSIKLNPNPSDLIKDESFESNQSILLVGGAPYSEGLGISLTLSQPLNN